VSRNTIWNKKRVKTVESQDAPVSEKNPESRKIDRLSPTEGEHTIGCSFGTSMLTNPAPSPGHQGRSRSPEAEHHDGVDDDVWHRWATFLTPVKRTALRSGLNPAHEHDEGKPVISGQTTLIRDLVKLEVAASVERVTWILPEFSSLRCRSGFAVV